MWKNNHKMPRNYVIPSEKIPFIKWLNGLKDPSMRLRIRRRLDRLELSSLGGCKSLGEGAQ